MTTTTQQAQSLIQIIEGDVLAAFGTPLLTLIEAIKTSNGNPFADVAAWGQFTGNLAPSLVGLEQAVAQQLLTAIETKLTAAMAKAKTAPTA